MGKKTNGHPGQVLEGKFLKPMDLSRRKLAADIGVPVSRINSVIKGKAAITADLALRLGRYFGNGPEFWLKLQMDHDLRTAGEEIGNELEAIPQHGAEVQKSSPAENSGREAERKKIRDAWLEKNKDRYYVKNALDVLASADLNHPDDKIAGAAIAVGDMEAVRKIEKAGFNRWCIPEVGYYAFESPCSDIVEFLVGKGYDINTVYRNGKYTSTPLCLAVEHGFSDVVDYLISVGADVHFRDQHGFTPLHLAAPSRSLAIVKALVAAGSDINARTFPNRMRDVDPDAMSVLFYMARYGFLEGMQYLIRQGARLRHPKEAQSLLHGVCESCVLVSEAAYEFDELRETTEYLLDSGFDPFQLDWYGFSSVYYAASKNNVAALRGLVSRGVPLDRPNVCKYYGKQLLPLEIAACCQDSGEEQLIETLELISAHSLPFSRTHVLNCAVHAERRPRAQVCRRLLEKGCPVNDVWIPPDGAFVCNRKYYSPLHAVTSCWNEKRAEIVSVLLAAGADVNQHDPAGCTPLAYAVAHPSGDIVEVITLLHNAGADFNAKTSDGRTILQIAKSNMASPEVVDLLRNFGAQ